MSNLTNRVGGHFCDECGDPMPDIYKPESSSTFDSRDEGRPCICSEKCYIMHINNKQLTEEMGASPHPTNQGGELKVCPWCCGIASISTYDEGEYWAYCPSCKACSGVQTSESKAIEVWNFRATERGLESQLSAAKDTITDLKREKLKDSGQLLRESMEREAELRVGRMEFLGRLSYQDKAIVSLEAKMAQVKKAYENHKSRKWINDYVDIDSALSDTRPALAVVNTSVFMGAGGLTIDGIQLSRDQGNILFFELPNECSLVPGDKVTAVVLGGGGK